MKKKFLVNPRKNVQIQTGVTVFLCDELANPRLNRGKIRELNPGEFIALAPLSFGIGQSFTMTGVVNKRIRDSATVTEVQDAPDDGDLPEADDHDPPKTDGDVVSVSAPEPEPEVNQPESVQSSTDDPPQETEVSEVDEIGQLKAEIKALEAEKAKLKEEGKRTSAVTRRINALKAELEVLFDKGN